MASTTFGGTPIWAASWDRTRRDRNDDWFGLAAITATHLIIAQPKETDQASRTLQAKAHQLLNSTLAAGEPPRGLSVAEQLVRSCAKRVIIERTEVLSIKALAKGNLLRIQTASGVHLVGDFGNKRDVTRVAADLASILLPGIEPRMIARPRLTAGLLRQLAIAPSVAAFFFAIALAVRIAIDDRGAVTPRGRNRGVEEALQVIPVPVLAAIGLLVVAMLVVRIMFRAQDEVHWAVPRATSERSTPAPASEPVLEF